MPFFDVKALTGAAHPGGKDMETLSLTYKATVCSTLEYGNETDLDRL